MYSKQGAEKRKGFLDSTENLTGSLSDNKSTSATNMSEISPRHTMIDADESHISLSDRFESDKKFLEQSQTLFNENNSIISSEIVKETCSEDITDPFPATLPPKLSSHGSAINRR